MSWEHPSKLITNTLSELTNYQRYNFFLKHRHNLFLKTKKIINKNINVFENAFSYFDFIAYKNLTPWIFCLLICNRFEYINRIKEMFERVLRLDPKEYKNIS